MSWSLEDEETVDSAVLAAIYALPMDAANRPEMYRQTANRLNVLAGHLDESPKQVRTTVIRKGDA